MTEALGGDAPGEEDQIHRVTSAGEMRIRKVKVGEEEDSWEKF